MLLVADVALIPVAFALSPWVLLPVLTLPLAARLARTVRAHVDGPTLNAALARTGMLQLAFCVLLSAGILAS
jgi:1,4-dihydroxy-2-naphthoate octaprenyltransferase